MKIIIPMAGMGKRMRPHTLTIPKPLIPIAGKPIIQHLVDEIGAVLSGSINEIAFIIGDFGKDVEDKLLNIANEIGAKGKIYYQLEPKGTAHAILCAEESLEGNVIIAYADTLFKATFSMDESKDSIIWVHNVENPSSFGVVELDNDKHITGFYEKPEKFISDLAIIGIYYFRDGENLKTELQYLIDRNIKTGGEFGITDALENMLKKGVRISIESVEEWLDCGNKDTTVNTNKRLLEFNNNKNLISETAEIVNSVIIKPCFIGANSKISNSVIGPYVSIGENTHISKSIINECIIQNYSKISNQVIHNSMVGNYVKMTGKPIDLSVGDYTEIK